MTSIDEPSDSTPPALNLDAVREARSVVERLGKNAYGVGNVVNADYLIDLLGAYDALAARHALLAAQYAELAAEERVREAMENR